MTLSDLASVGSFISGVAVLVSLIYLSLQARQSTASFHRAEANETQNQASVFRMAIVESRDVAQIWAVGLKDDGALDEIDELRFETLLTELFWHSFNLWDRARRGIFGEPGSIDLLSYLAEPLSNKRGSRWWGNNRNSCPRDFALAVDKAIGDFRTCSR